MKDGIKFTDHAPLDTEIPVRGMETEGHHITIRFDRIPFHARLNDGVLEVEVPISDVPAPMFTEALSNHARYEVGKKAAAQILEHLQREYYRRIIANHMGV